MEIQELKNQLHESIENISDLDFLQAVKQIFIREYEISSDPKLSEWQIKRIKSAKKQIKQGNFLTNEQANNVIDKWLNTNIKAVIK
jgi:predicted transcriptional regulator